MLNELIAAGRSLLRAQPMNKDDCFQWSDEARIKIAELYGASSPQTREFFKARWEISTSFETDPSYYLTQVGANLRRELRILEKFLRQEGGTPGGPPAARRPTAPSRKAPARNKILILRGLDPERSGQAAGILTDLGFSPTEVSEKDRRAIGPLRAALNGTDVAGALVFVDRDPASRGARLRPRIESILELGILIGGLGPERVIVLVDPRVALPPQADPLQQVSLEEPDSLGVILKKSLESLAATS